MANSVEQTGRVPPRMAHLLRVCVAALLVTPHMAASPRGPQYTHIGPLSLPYKDRKSVIENLEIIIGQGSVGHAKTGGAEGAIDDQAVSLLYMACVLGSEPQARRALDNGADVNNPGLSPLHVAAWYGYTDVALTLVQRGATLWRRTEKRFTALMLAAMNNHTDSVKMLLQNGAEVVPRDVYDLSGTRKKVAKDVLDILHKAAGMNLPRKETKRRRRAAKPVPPKETTRPRPATEPVGGSGNTLVEYVAHFVIVVLFGIIAFAFVSIGHFYLVATVLFTPLLVVAGFVAGYGALISFVLVVGGSCQVALWRWGDEWAEARAARAERDLLKGDAPAPAASYAASPRPE